MSSHQQYLDLFRTHRSLLEENSCAAMNARRAAAAVRLEASGLPDTRVERYKYCDAFAAFAPDYGLNLSRAVSAADPGTRYRCQVPNLSTAVYFVENDVAIPAAEHTAPEGVSVVPFRLATGENRQFIEEYYDKLASASGDGVTALNTLLAQDGWLVRIAPGARPKHPVQIVNVSSARAALMSNRRLLVVAGAGSEATLLLCDHAEGKTAYLTTQVTEVFVGDGAALHLYGIEETGAKNTRFSQLYVRQEGNSRVISNNITLTCGLTRNMSDVCLAEPYAEVVMNGAVIADAAQRVDNNILVDHSAEHCSSNLLYKSVLDGSAVGAFAGRVLVREGAQHTASEQTNAYLCASAEARAFSQPMLEIYADDVKCNHGSTIGKLDETALFYMRQRGIPEGEAQILLRHAFVNDVLRRIDNEHLRERLSRLVELRFRGGAAHCSDCGMCGK